MRKILLVLFTFQCSLFTAWSQTNFRSITYEQALAAARAEGKPVFIDFYTSWCGPCKMMARDVFPQPKVGDYFNASFVCIKLDAEKEGKEQARKFEVKAYPTFKVIDADENVIYTFVGGNSDSDGFIAQIKAGVNPELTPDKSAERYAQGDRSADLVSAYANQLYKDGREQRPADETKIEKAQQIIDDYFASLTTEQRLSDDNSFVYAYNFCNKATDPKARFLIDHRADFAESRQAEVNKTLQTLCLYRIGTVLQGQDRISPQEVNLLKGDIAALGLDQGKEKDYEAAYRVLAALATNDPQKYIAQLEKDFKNLDVSTRSSAAMGLAQALNSDDKTIVARADKWLRSQLADLDASTIYYASGSLVYFERILNDNQH